MIRIAAYKMPESDSLARLVSLYPLDRVEVSAVPPDVYERLVTEDLKRTAGAEADLFDISFALVDSVGDRLLDLQPIVVGRPDAADTFYRGLVERLTRAGRTVAAPWRSSSYLVAYRRDLARKLGVAPPDSIPRAIEFARAAHQQIGSYGYASAQRGSLHLAMEWLPFLWEYGGDLVQGGRVVMNSPQAVDALEAYVDLCAYAPWQSLNFEYADPVERLVEGQAAMIQQWCAGAAAASGPGKWAQEVGFLPGLGRTVLGGGGLGIPREHPNPEPLLAFLDWMLDPALDVERVRLGGTSIYGATDGRLKHDPPDFWPARQAAISRARDRPRQPQWRAIQNLVARTVRDAVSGLRTPREAIADGAADMEAILGGFAAG